MKPAPFDYVVAECRGDALRVLRDRAGDAAVLAGGQSLVPSMNLRRVRPAVLVDINRLAELGRIEGDGTLEIGAVARQSAVIESPAVSDRAPLLVDALRRVGHPAIRNRGTVGGSAALAHPAAELPAALVALDAELVLERPDSTRAVPAGEFFRGEHETAADPDELLTGIRVPKRPAGERRAFVELSRRRSDWALAGVAGVASCDDGGGCVDARIVVFAVGDRPARAREAERRLVGERLGDPRLHEETAGLTAKDVEAEARSDMHAPADYRRRVTDVLARRALDGMAGAT